MFTLPKYRMHCNWHIWTSKYVFQKDFSSHRVWITQFSQYFCFGLTPFWVKYSSTLSDDIKCWQLTQCIQISHIFLDKKEKIRKKWRKKNTRHFSKNNTHCIKHTIHESSSSLFCCVLLFWDILLSIKSTGVGKLSCNEESIPFKSFLQTGQVPCWNRKENIWAENLLWSKIDWLIDYGLNSYGRYF